MTLYLHKSSLFITAMILALGFVLPPAAAVTGQILDDENVAEADAATLKSEARLFVRIKDGVMLTLAECDLSENCSPSVDSREIERILFKIDTRITTLSERYAEDSNKQLEEALLIYADAREGYAKALNKLEALSINEEQVPREDGAGGTTDGEEDFSDLFEDADEEL